MYLRRLKAVFFFQNDLFVMKNKLYTIHPLSGVNIPFAHGDRVIYELYYDKVRSIRVSYRTLKLYVQLCENKYTNNYIIFKRASAAVTGQSQNFSAMRNR